MKRIRTLVFTALTCCTISSCDKLATPKEEGSATPAAAATAPRPQFFINKTDLIPALSHGALAALQPAIDGATQLRANIDSFLAKPDSSTLQAAQEAWFASLTAYRQFAFFKHIGLVDPKTFARLNRLDYQIASYPIQPGFIDTFGAYQFSGLVHDISFPITRESLENQHGLTDLADVVMGLHAMEFLLFNLDGQRNVEDFAPHTTVAEEYKARGYEQADELPNNRRRQLLALQAQLLVENLREVESLWSPGQTTPGVPAHLQALPQAQCGNLLRRALAGSITQLMLEIGEFNQAREDYLAVSPMMRGASHAQKLAFVKATLQATALLHTLVRRDEDKAAVLAPLEEALRLTDDSAHLQAGQEEQERAYWSDVFALIKAASDAIP